MRVLARFSSRLACQRGATAIEYGLIAALVVVVMLIALGLFADSATGLFERIEAAFPVA
jgi:pilus assembly protein Flp/PilA